MTPSSVQHPWLLVYDGQCPFCVSCVAVVRRWVGAQRIRPVPLQDERAWGGTPGLARPALERAMHLVAPDGRVFVGAEALAPLLRLLPRGGVWAAPLSLPGANRLAGVVYRWVARRRHRRGCASPVCRRGD